MLVDSHLGHGSGSVDLGGWCVPILFWARAGRLSHESTGIFCAAGFEREFTLEETLNYGVRETVWIFKGLPPGGGFCNVKCI